MIYLLLTGIFSRNYYHHVKGKNIDYGYYIILSFGIHFRGILQSMVIKKPMDIDYENDTVEQIVEKLQFAIEQHPSFLKVTKEDDYYKSEKELNKKREFWDMY